jgi:hypothetical protein
MWVKRTASARRALRQRYQAARGGATPGGAAALASALALAGCDGCAGDRPYTPYQLEDGKRADAGGDDAGVTGAAPADAGADAAAPRPFAPVAGTRAPGEGKAWPLEGGAAIAAPAGRRFEAGLVTDADGDGKGDLLAWARAPDGLRGELVFAASGKAEAPTTVVAMPTELVARGCTTSPSVAQVGPRTVALDMTVRCPERAEGRPARWIAIVMLPGARGAGAAGTPELRLELRLSPPAADETFGLTVDASDQDADGRDDVTATLTFTSGSASKASPAAARVRFFDRPAGLSRDASEPEGSLYVRAQALSVEARKKGGAASVAAGTLAVERLHAALCDEDGAPLLTTSAGPIKCGDAPSLVEATYARAVAALTGADFAGALLAKARLDAIAGPSSARQKDLEKVVTKQIPPAPFTVRHRSQATPKGEAPPAVAWSPLAFEHVGHLLVRVDGGVTRIDRESFAEAPAEVPPWPEAVATRPADPAAAAAVVRAVAEGCAPPALLAEIAPASGDPTTAPALVPLPIAAPVSAAGFPAARCEATPRVRVTPLDATSDRVVLAIGARSIAIAPAASPATAAEVPLTAPAPDRPLGAARSPDGVTAALPVPQGLLVQSGPQARLWASPDLASTWGCVPSNGGRRVACVVSGTAVLYEAQ